MEALLGPTLLTKDGEKPTAEVLGGKTVGLYFSAHWCPPCRGFTPKLADMYLSAFKAKGMEIVFVSSDRDPESFSEYYGEQPWAALPFSNRAAKAAVSQRFKIRGIPSLVILDSEGNTINGDALQSVAGDPTGDKFPWAPPTKAEKGAANLAALGDDIVAKAGDRPIALYFSAHWCPPCRGFTPKLAQYYEDGLKENLEIVFVSSDRDQAAFDTYAGEQPWPALPFDKRKEAQELGSICGIEGIPTLVLLDATGSVVTTDGRAKVMGDQKGLTIAAGGWAPQPFNDVNDAPGALNEGRCVVALASDESMWAAVESAAAEACEAAGGDPDAMEVKYFKARKGGVEGQLRAMTGLSADANKLLVFDIPDNGAFYSCDDESIFAASTADKASVQAFLKAVADGTVPKQRFKRPSADGCTDSACTTSG